MGDVVRMNKSVEAVEAHFGEQTVLAYSLPVAIGSDLESPEYTLKIWLDEDDARWHWERFEHASDFSYATLVASSDGSGFPSSFEAQCDAMQSLGVRMLQS
jgi:hypothetical protein